MIITTPETSPSMEAVLTARIKDRTDILRDVLAPNREIIDVALKRFA